MLDKIGVRVANFMNMSRAQQRVAIARDIIMQLDTREIEPEPGRYIKQSRRACHVCALGALAVSVFDGDAVEMFELHGSSALREALKGYFSIDQLHMIESAFEGWSWMRAEDELSLLLSEGDRVWDFRRMRQLTPEGRMREIMSNIIDCGGEFNPVKLADAGLAECDTVHVGHEIGEYCLND